MKEVTYFWQMLHYIFFFIRGSVHFKTENLQNYKAEKQKKACPKRDKL